MIPRKTSHLCFQPVLREPALHHVHLHGDQRRAAAQPGDGALRAQLHLQDDPRLRLLLPGGSDPDGDRARCPEERPLTHLCCLSSRS